MDTARILSDIDAEIRRLQEAKTILLGLQVRLEIYPTVGLDFP